MYGRLQTKMTSFVQTNAYVCAQEDPPWDGHRRRVWQATFIHCICCCFKCLHNSKWMAEQHRVKWSCHCKILSNNQNTFCQPVKHVSTGVTATYARSGVWYLKLMKGAPWWPISWGVSYRVAYIDQHTGFWICIKYWKVLVLASILGSRKIYHNLHEEKDKLLFQGSTHLFLFM